jgi:hypothetical protein
MLLARRVFRIGKRTHLRQEMGAARDSGKFLNIFCIGDSYVSGNFNVPHK